MEAGVLLMQWLKLELLDFFLNQSGINFKFENVFKWL